MDFKQEIALVLLAAPFLLAAAFLKAPEIAEQLNPLPTVIASDYPSIVYVPTPQLKPE
jgi:hypothetical protein